MADINIKELNFGAPAAERDQNLIDYFVERESYINLRDGNKTIALGNRGSGKTAIFKMLATHSRSRGKIVIEITPEDFSYELLRESMIAERDGSWQKQSAYTASWKYVLYVLAMKAQETKRKGYRKGDAAKIYNYLRDNHKNVDINPIGTLISYLKRIEGIKIGDFHASMKSRSLQELYGLEEINKLIPSLRNLLKKQSLVILVDELDRGWDASEDAKSFVAGLFRAAQSINERIPELKILLSLRKELYNSIPSLYEDAQKVRDIIEVIEWDEDSLFDLITRRISASSRNNPKPLGEINQNKLWNEVFAETLDYRQTKSFNYIIDRTLYRPREIIQFCESIRERASSKNDTPPINYKTISEAELTYSELRLKDIAAEYRFEYPGLESVFETFRGLPYTFDRNGLELHLLRIIVGELNVGDAKSWSENINSEEFIGILWRVGFLRAQTVGGVKARQRSGSSYLGPHQISSLSLENLNRFHVHQMFRTYLAMKEGVFNP